MKHLRIAKDIADKGGVGSKAYGLAVLTNAGFRTAPWVAIPNEVLSELANGNKEVIKAELESELSEYFTAEQMQQNFAVRSSSLEEDSEDFSFAGQFETFLNIPFNEVVKYCEEVWDSANSERVKEYRKQHSQTTNQGIGVVIQMMIEPDVSGVAFGMNPMNGSKEEKLISSVYGLGEGLVSGKYNADTFIVKEDGIEAEIAEKTKALKSVNEGLQEFDVDEVKIKAPSLDDSQLKEISKEVGRLNKVFNSPQDVEFALSDGTLYILQSRPITTKATNSGEYIVWDNSNIVESYPGITTPLTYSFILEMYEMVYKQLVGLLGVKKKEIKKHEEVFEQTLGLVRGRVYYNLLNWYKMLAMLPGYSINAEHMETMMGVKEKFELKGFEKMGKTKARLRVWKMYLNMIGLQIKLPGSKKRFQREFNDILEEYKAIDFDHLSLGQIANKYKEYENRVLLKWKAPLVNDFFTMIWFGMLKKQAEKHCPDVPNLHNDLLCGNQDIISVEPIHRLLDLTELILSDESSKQFFTRNEPQQIWKGLSDHVQVKEKFDEYLEKFGERCVGELKLETISYKQDPTVFVGIVKSYVEQGIGHGKGQNNIDQELRSKAEYAVKQALKGKPIKRSLFKFILKQTRAHVSGRENLRFERTRAFGMVRIMFRAIGKKLFEQGMIDDKEDVFYLELDEIKSIDDSGISAELSRTVKARKQEFADYESIKPPKARFYTYGNDFRDEYIYSDEKMELIEGDLSGIGCCPGVVKSKVMVIMDPTEIKSLEGCI